jgi:lactoylglutathione lyase
MVDVESEPRAEPAGALAAVGIVVQDLDRALSFYTDVVGMKEVQRVDVPDKSLVESILQFPGPPGPAVVLMHFSDGVDHTYVDIGGKVVLRVDDVVRLVEIVRAAGGEVTREPSEYPGFGLIGMVKDRDGYTIELVQAQALET